MKGKLIDEWERELTPNVQNLYSLCMPIECRGDFNRQAPSQDIKGNYLKKKDEAS